MVKTASLGMPRIGNKRELVEALNCYRLGEINATLLAEVGAAIRLQNWQIQKDAKIDIIPCNDFSLYDHVLDASVLLGNIPRRYYWEGGIVPHDIYFAMIYGQQKEKFDAHPMAMSRWFNSHYVYVVPELADPIDFAYSDNKAILHHLEAKQKLSIKTRPVFLGPISYLLMSRVASEDLDEIKPLELLDDMMVVYNELFSSLARIGITDVQFDEPMLVTNLTREAQAAYKTMYNKLAKAGGGKIKIHLTTAYGAIGNNFDCVASLPIQSLHIDVAKNLSNLDDIIADLPQEIILSLGVVDASNVWINNITESAKIVSAVVEKMGQDRVIVAPSSSLFLCPYDTENEVNFDKEILSYLSFTKQKLDEVNMIAAIVNGQASDFKEKIEINQKKSAELSNYSLSVVEKLRAVKANNVSHAVDVWEAKKNYGIKRVGINHAMPITVVGDMPSETKENQFTINEDLCAKIAEAIKIQEDAGVDLVSCGEIERTNNLEYFASILDGALRTDFGYVQHNGPICIKPPIFFDIISPAGEPFIDIAKYCLAIAKKPIKMTLIGPVSMVNFAFILPEINRDLYYGNLVEIVCGQIAALKSIGVLAVGLDEELLLQQVPLREEGVVSHFHALKKALDEVTFKSDPSICVQVHVKYDAFSNYIDGLVRLDLESLSLELSRSRGAIFDALVSYRYGNDIGIGVFEPYSARLPTKVEVATSLRKAMRVLDREQIWITMDSGLRHRTPQEAKEILSIICEVAQDLRCKP